LKLTFFDEVLGIARALKSKKDIAEYPAYPFGRSSHSAHERLFCIDPKMKQRLVKAILF
jgi:hypothetical protein